MKKVAILGAGIQGVCCAFALHDQGYDVTLFDKSKEVMTATSQNQEGRVHMGFTYALDATDRTGEMMMHSALNFSHLMEEWLGPVDWDKFLLSEGYYLIHKSESLLSEDDIVNYYHRLQKIYDRLLEGENLSYFGQRQRRIFEVLPELPGEISGSKVSRAVKTIERIVEMFTFRELLIENLQKRNIRIRTGTEVRKVVRRDSGFTVSLSCGGIQEQFDADIVVNCLWNNRVEIDKTLGVEPPQEMLYRFKIGLLGRVKSPLPNCTIVSGAFGNVSPRLDGTYAYLSWHTECMLGLTTDGTTPQEWESYFEPERLGEVNKEWVVNSIERIAEFVPAAASFVPIRLLPGIICSSGKTDIHDKESNVHKRADQMGICEYDGYFSINTGKFSSAPLHAKELVSMLDKVSRGKM